MVGCFFVYFEAGCFVGVFLVDEKRRYMFAESCSL